MKTEFDLSGMVTAGTMHAKALELLMEGPATVAEIQEATGSTTASGARTLVNRDLPLVYGIGTELCEKNTYRLSGHVASPQQIRKLRAYNKIISDGSYTRRKAAKG